MISGPKYEVIRGIWVHNDCFQCSICGFQLSGVRSEETHFLSGKFYCNTHGKQMKRISSVGVNSLKSNNVAATGPTGPNLSLDKLRLNSFTLEQGRKVDVGKVYQYKLLE